MDDVTLAFAEWLSQWFEENLTYDTFQRMSDEEMGSALAKDITEAGWHYTHVSASSTPTGLDVTVTVPQ